MAVRLPALRRKPDKGVQLIDVVWPAEEGDRFVLVYEYDGTFRRFVELNEDELLLLKEVMTK